MYNILEEPCVTVRCLDGTTRRVSIPELFCLLERDQALDFPRLQAHQRHPWHAFLTQLACLALEHEDLPEYRAGMRAPTGAMLVGEHDQQWWTKALLALTRNDADPWNLVVEDTRKPAFLQPPALEGITRDWKTSETPDELDVLISSKNHGVKQRRMEACEPEDWLFALLSVQTHGAYLGPGNYGIARQNGGFSTRPGISLVTSPLPGMQWAMDTRIILDHMDDLAPELYGDSSGLALLWLEPWDGKQSVSMEDLHPLFVEVCRRIRLKSERGRIGALKAGSTRERVRAKDMNGNVGDPWVPIELSGSKSFAGKPDYRNLSKILDSGRFAPPLLLNFNILREYYPPHGLFLQCRVLVRGQGKIEGYFERRIPVPPRVFTHTDSLGRFAARMADAAQKAESSTRAGLLRYLAGGGDKNADRDKEWVRERMDLMDRDVDMEFFPCLWEAVEQYDQNRQTDGEMEGLRKDAEERSLRNWFNRLRFLANKHFEAGLAGLPRSGARMLKSEAVARRYFSALLRKWFPLTADAVSREASVIGSGYEEDEA